MTRRALNATAHRLLAALPHRSPRGQVYRRRQEPGRQETLKYLSIPYLWGGTSPKSGLDCSGFVQLVFSKAGLNLPRVARDQYAASLHLKPTGVLPGDMIFFSMKKPGSSHVDHIGIYVGKGFFVHASVSNGIHIDSISNPYYFQRIVSVRKYRGF